VLPLVPTGGMMRGHVRFSGPVIVTAVAGCVVVQPVNRVAATVMR
jgi:hypothetical protein